MTAKERLALILKFFEDLDATNLRWERETFLNFNKFYMDTEEKFPGYLMLVYPEIKTRMKRVSHLANVLD
jgi:hypothetical protein